VKIQPPVPDAVAGTIARAMYTVASAGGTLPRNGADRAAIVSVLETVFGPAPVARPGPPARS
jgi:hypothetical protein